MWRYCPCGASAGPRPDRHMASESLTRELWEYMKVRKKWWLLPIMITMVLPGALLVVAQGSALAPFIYTIFQRNGSRWGLDRRWRPAGPTEPLLGRARAGGRPARSSRPRRTCAGRAGSRDAASESPVGASRADRASPSPPGAGSSRARRDSLTRNPHPPHPLLHRGERQLQQSRSDRGGAVIVVPGRFRGLALEEQLRIIVEGRGAGTRA